MPTDDAGGRRSALRYAASVGDQVLVSGTNFLMALVIGRYAGAEALGVFSLAFSALLLALVVLETLIATPYVVRESQRDPAARRQSAGHGLMMASGLSLALAALLLGGALLGWAVGWTHAPLLFASAVACPALILREFTRRYLLAHLRVVAVLVLDFAVASLAVSLLGLLVWGDRLTVPLAMLCLATATGVPALAMLGACWREFGGKGASLGATAGRYWRFGRWILATEATTALGMPAVYWVLSILASVEAAGILAACSTLVRAVNPLFLGIVNVLEPALVRGLASGGVRRLDAMVRNNTLLMLAATVPIGVTVWILGDALLRVLFGAEFVGNRATLTMLIAATLSSTASFPASSGLRALNRPDLNFHVRAAAFALLLLLAVALAPIAGVLGVAAAMLVTSLLSLFGRWWVYLRVSAHADAGAIEDVGVTDA